MLLNTVIIASTAAAQAAVADAKHRQEQGLPPINVEAREMKTTLEDRFWEAMLYVFILLPGLILGLAVGGFGYIILKVAFARQGVTFP